MDHHHGIDVLEAVAVTKVADAGPVMAQMKLTTVRDMFTEDGQLSPSGLMVHDWYVAKVKTPAEQRYPWDYYQIVATVPAKDTVRPTSECPL